MNARTKPANFDQIRDEIGELYLLGESPREVSDAFGVERSLWTLNAMHLFCRERNPEVYYAGCRHKADGKRYWPTVAYLKANAAHFSKHAKPLATIANIRQQLDKLEQQIQAL